MYLIIWEFQAKQGGEVEFEAAYGPDGEWARLFKRGEGYLGTELLRDAANPQRYITIDRWTSAAAYDSFRARWRGEYQAIDARCEGLTERESLLGALTAIK